MDRPSASLPRPATRSRGSQLAATVARMAGTFVVAILVDGITPALGQPGGIGPDRGFQLATTCSSCHRLDGRSSEIPSIVGMDETGLKQTLLAYKSGARQSQIMHAVAASLSDDEIAILAHYLAQQRQRAARW